MIIALKASSVECQIGMEARMGNVTGKVAMKRECWERVRQVQMSMSMTEILENTKASAARMEL